MKGYTTLLPEILAHAEREQPRECCGLVVRLGKALNYRPCRNIAEGVRDQFTIAPEDYASAEDAGDVVMVVHSHVNLPAEPSAADIAGIEASGLPWLIVNWPTGAHTVTAPAGAVVPLEGREFVHGVHDCYGLVQDYYRGLGIELRDYPRAPEWWLRGENLYRENFEREGFVELPAGTPPREHDLLLMRVRSPVENHAAVYVGANVILHHVMGRLSCCEVYETFWRRQTSGVLRHSFYRSC